MQFLEISKSLRKNKLSHTFQKYTKWVQKRQNVIVRLSCYDEGCMKCKRQADHPIQRKIWVNQFRRALKKQKKSVLDDPI